MQVVVIGAGAMGCVFGAALARSGADVSLLVVRADLVAALRRDGLMLSGALGERTVRLPATDDPEALPQADLAVVLVDSNATAQAATLAARILAPHGAALTVQNGIGNVETLGAALGSGRVVGGSSYNSAAVLGPGRVLHSNRGETVIGTSEGPATPLVEELAERLTAAGLPTRVSTAVMGEIWSKFLLNCAANPVAAVTGLRPGEIVRTPAAARLLDRILDECLAVVAAKGITLPEADPRASVLDHCWVRYNRPSMLQHVEQGRRTEIDALNGALVREAAALGVPVPFNEAIVLAVKAIDARMGRPAIDEAALEAAARATPRPVPA
jgi:2-dehydropantoate 2-reductase